MPRNNMPPPPPPCRVHSQDPRVPVFLGPGEGKDHEELVREARQKLVSSRSARGPPKLTSLRGFLSAQPDFTLVTGDYFEKIFKKDLLRESPHLREWYNLPETYLNVPSQTLTLKGPVLPIHMSKITDFLYSGDYSISAVEVLGYPTAFRGRETKCRPCDNLFRVLSLHLGIFHAARYIHLENLERLAILRFAQILTFCPLPVIRMAVDEVYSVKPHVCKDQIEDTYSLAEIVDYRERFVGAAVLRCVRQRLESMRGDAQNGKQDPALPFRDLGAMYPDFARHMREWFHREFSQKTVSR